MKQRVIKDGWTLTILGENVYGIKEEPIAAVVPGTVYSTLRDHDMMPDPYYRDEELSALKLMENDFVFACAFTLSEEELSSEELFLRFEGVDTIADIYVNDILLASVDDMHRTYELDLKAVAQVENALRVYFHSPTKYIEEADREVYAGGSAEAMVGFPHLRKAACMFGWDWGPRLPDAGLFRNVSIVSANSARIEQVYITQHHEVTGHGVHGNTVSQVTLDIRTDLHYPASITPVAVTACVCAPDGKSICAANGVLAEVNPASPLSNSADTELTITNPRLWWPAGYGKQPLYEVTVTLMDERTGEELDHWTAKIGLRTVTVNQDPMPDEQWDEHMEKQEQKDTKPGRNFAFEVNGLQIFAMGADYIPEDNILTRHTRERTGHLLRDAVEAHHNCIRVWGGGYFLDDFFYDLCDELGLLVWQDFLFACADYDLNPHFEENVKAEVRDNVRRLRHHASLGLWCGNNEMETMILSESFQPTMKQKCDYIRLYEYIIPKIVEVEDPNTFYWPSSPSSGGNYDDPNAENIGDVHYWGVWHGSEPYTAYRKHHYRFLSEFGFQSFPEKSSVDRFTLPEDRNIFSRIMEMHQRNSAANGKIMNYLSATYLYPSDFDVLLYCSQLLQADAIRYGVEHFRRFRGTCMGTVVWQLNDIWPVASWASIDYYGKWKALHYAEKRMFAPIMISCEEHGEIDQKPYPNSQPKPVKMTATLHVANETDQEIRGTVEWSLCTPDSEVTAEGCEVISVAPYSGTWLSELDFEGHDLLREHLTYAFIVNDEVVSSGSALFCAPKHYAFADPKLQCTREGNEITITSEAYAKAVCLETEEGTLRLDDNYFDMEKGTHTVHLVEDCADLPIFARSVYDIRS